MDGLSSIGRSVMQQQPCAEGSSEQYRKPTRRERSLLKIEPVISWEQLVAVIGLCYPDQPGSLLATG
jgi:IS5 family transposase